MSSIKKLSKNENTSIYFDVFFAFLLPYPHGFHRGLSADFLNLNETQ